jgi:uncharacterized membrane protein
MSTTDIAVAIYDSHEKAERAVKTLQRGGFDMKKLSIIGKDYHTEEHVVGYFNGGDRAKFFGKLGAFWGGLAGMLFGAALVGRPISCHAAGSSARVFVDSNTEPGRFPQSFKSRRRELHP